MKKVLFVCTGNTCRSIMAEGLFNSVVAKEDEAMRQFKAYSAGISAFDGACASDNAYSVLKSWGIDISYHKSKRVTQQDVDSAFLILTMTREHKRALLQLFPEAEDKVYTLKEFAYDDCESMNNMSIDITDPYGMNEEVYRKCAIEIRQAIYKVLEKLKLKYSGQ